MSIFAKAVSRKSFKVTACIDWLDVTFTTSRPTQFWHVQAVLEKITGNKLYVEGMDEQAEAGNVATIFKVRFRDDLANDIIKLETTAEKLCADYPFSAIPTISGIEVACDFWHKLQSVSDTFAMTYRLQSSLFANGTKPRQFDPAISRNRFMDAGTRLDPRLNFRIGNKDDQLAWQVYCKTVDEKAPLEKDQWRARAEVTIQGGSLTDFGLHALSDLQDYSFVSLTPLFRFRRPVEVSKLSKGNLFVQTAIKANRKIHDATAERGIHSFRVIGRRDKWRKIRAESQHIEPDNELQDAVKGALRRLNL